MIVPMAAYAQFGYSYPPASQVSALHPYLPSYTPLDYIITMLRLEVNIKLPTPTYQVK